MPACQLTAWSERAAAHHHRVHATGDTSDHLMGLPSPSSTPGRCMEGWHTSCMDSSRRTGRCQCPTARAWRSAASASSGDIGTLAAAEKLLTGAMAAADGTLSPSAPPAVAGDAGDAAPGVSRSQAPCTALMPPAATAAATWPAVSGTPPAEVPAPPAAPAAGPLDSSEGDVVLVLPSTAALAAAAAAAGSHQEGYAMLWLLRGVTGSSPALRILAAVWSTRWEAMLELPGLRHTLRQAPSGVGECRKVCTVREGVQGSSSSSPDDPLLPAAAAVTAASDAAPARTTNCPSARLLPLVPMPGRCCCCMGSGVLGPFASSEALMAATSA